MQIITNTTPEQDKALEINGTTLQKEINRILQMQVSRAKEDLREQLVQSKTISELETMVSQKVIIK